MEKPKSKKIYLETDSDGDVSTIELSGTIEELTYLIAVAIDQVPQFLDVIKLAVDFAEYQMSKKELLEKAYDFCNSNDKSTEFMLQYMQDVADVNLDCVLDFLEKEHFISIESPEIKNKK